MYEGRKHNIEEVDFHFSTGVDSSKTSFEMVRWLVEKVRELMHKEEVKRNTIESLNIEIQRLKGNIK